MVTLIGCDRQINRPDDKVIEEFIRNNDIHVVELVKYKQYTAIAYKNESEAGLFLDQTGNGRFSKHWVNVEKERPVKRFLGGFSDKYLIEFIVDKEIADRIYSYKTSLGPFKKEPNQRCFVFPTGSGGIQYFDQTNNPIQF